MNKTTILEQINCAQNQLEFGVIVVMPMEQYATMNEKIVLLEEENEVLRLYASQMEEKIEISPGYTDAIAKDKFLTQHQRLLLERLYFLVCITGKNSVKATYSELARALGVKVYIVEKAIHALLKAGYICFVEPPVDGCKRIYKVIDVYINK